MNKLFAFALCLCCWHANVSAEAQQIETALGQIQYAINEDSSQCEFKHQEQLLMSFSCEFAYPPSVLGVFDGEFGEFTQVVILQESPMGNACNGGNLHLLGIRADNSAKDAGEISFCGGLDPELKIDPKQIIILFPGSTPNRGEGETESEMWVFDGSLTKSE